MKLIGICFIALIATIFANMFICGLIQVFDKIRYGYQSDVERLYIILFLPLWAIISFIFYYIFI